MAARMLAPCRSSPHSAVAGDEAFSDQRRRSHLLGGLVMSTTDPNAADQNAASVRSTISRKKLAANRRNARQSTGPRTDEGKAVSSRNAVTHAIFCRDLLV